MTPENVPSLAFDPDDWTTWPVPAHGVNTRRSDGRPWRLSPNGDGFVEGFELGLRYYDHFDKHGEWPKSPEELR